METAADLVPSTRSLDALADAAAGCRACPLWKTGTQTVFGAGPRRAEVVLVGEQPGDKEDLAGRPFVGPAGRVLDSALEQAGIDRDLVYVTNVVKHFKWAPRGKRRIHRKPNLSEITACRPWLEAELDAVRPEIVVSLGATAAQALLGRDFKVTKRHGEIVAVDFAPAATATLHPSAVLRGRDDAERHALMDELVADLTAVAHHLAGTGNGRARP